MGVKAGDIVKLHYTIKTEQGKELESSLSSEPIRFKVGCGEVIQGVEEEVIDMEVGEKKEITVSPKKSFGERKEQLIHKASKAVLQGRQTKVGDIIDLEIGSGRVVQARISHINEDSVTFDMNHPLAGMTLIFGIELVEIE